MTCAQAHAHARALTSFEVGAHAHAAEHPHFTIDPDMNDPKHRCELLRSTRNYDEFIGIIWSYNELLRIVVRGFLGS